MCGIDGCSGFANPRHLQRTTKNRWPETAEQEKTNAKLFKLSQTGLTFLFIPGTFLVPLIIL